MPIPHPTALQKLEAEVARRYALVDAAWVQMRLTHTAWDVAYLDADDPQRVAVERHRAAEWYHREAVVQLDQLLRLEDFAARAVARQAAR